MFRLESILISIFLLCLKVFKCEEVGQLTTDNFESITANHELVFVNFYADWCRFSQILAPVFEEAYAKVKQDFPEPNRVFFGKVDCEAQSSLASRFHITKYPTLKLIINRKTAKKEYRGQRSIEAITSYIKDLLKDPVKLITAQNDDTEIVKKQGAIVAYSHDPPANNPALYDVFRKVAIDLKSDCNFFWITGEKAAPHLLITEKLRIVFKPPRTEIGSQDVTYPGTLQSYDEFSTWSTNKCIPLVREITFENAEELTEEGLPFLILFHNPDDRKSVEFYTEIVHKELYSESPSINFLTADGQKFAHPLHHLGKSTKDLPLIAIDSFRHMYLFPNYEDIKIPGKLAQFVQDLHSGKLHRVFHFGPEPDQDAHSDNQIMTSPPESTFKKLAPSRNRYTLLRDEL